VCKEKNKKNKKINQLTKNKEKHSQLDKSEKGKLIKFLTVLMWKRKKQIHDGMSTDESTCMEPIMTMSKIRNDVRGTISIDCSAESNRIANTFIFKYLTI
jgi:hypothetical protein